jgi:hypothetical protein
MDMTANTRPSPTKRSVAKTASQPSPKTKGKTKLIVKYDCGFNNTFTLRGSGAGLSWTKGVPLKNIGQDVWVFETLVPFKSCECKILLNDTLYENGPNRHLAYGREVECTPNFAS